MKLVIIILVVHYYYYVVIIVNYLSDFIIAIFLSSISHLSLSFLLFLFCSSSLPSLSPPLSYI